MNCRWCLRAIPDKRSIQPVWEKGCPFSMDVPAGRNIKKCGATEAHGAEPCRRLGARDAAGPADAAPPEARIPGQAEPRAEHRTQQDRCRGELAIVEATRKIAGNHAAIFFGDSSCSIVAPVAAGAD
jgi:hypothetical protein